MSFQVIDSSKVIHTDISELSYPYANKNPERNPFRYHPDNVHLESIIADAYHTC